MYVGSLKVQIIENLLRCPAEGCFKNFRNNTLLQMHIKHYHRELRKMLGATPKVLDLARKRTKPTDLEPPKPRHEPESKIIKVKIRAPKRSEEPKLEIKPKLEEPELNIDIPLVPNKIESPIPRSQDSPKLRQALANKPVKRPRVLLPVKRPDPEPVVEEKEEPNLEYDDSTIETVYEPPLEALDFEMEISTHTVHKPLDDIRKKIERKRKYFSTISKKPLSEDDEWYANSDMETRSSFPGSGKFCCRIISIVIFFFCITRYIGPEFVRILKLLVICLHDAFVVFFLMYNFLTCVSHYGGINIII